MFPSRPFSVFSVTLRWRPDCVMPCQSFSGLSVASSLTTLLLILGTCQIRFDFILPGTLSGGWLRGLGASGHWELPWERMMLWENMASGLLAKGASTPPAPNWSDSPPPSRAEPNNACLWKWGIAFVEIRARRSRAERFWCSEDFLARTREAQVVKESKP